MSTDNYSHVKATDRGEAEERKEAFRLQAEAQAGRGPSRSVDPRFHYISISADELKA